MNLIKERSVDIGIRWLDKRDRKKALGWLDRLANWENDPSIREICKRTPYDDIYVLNTPDDLRFFFKFGPETKDITIVDLARPSRFAELTGATE